MTWSTFWKSIFAGWFWPRCTICDEFYDECEHRPGAEVRPGYKLIATIVYDGDEVRYIRPKPVEPSNVPRPPNDRS